MDNYQKKIKNGIRMVLFFFCCMAMVGFTAPAVNAEETSGTVNTNKSNYLTDEQYEQIGFGSESAGLSLNDPDEFKSDDTSNPLSGYKATVQSELFVGSMNKNGENFKGYHQIANGANSKDDLGVEKMLGSDSLTNQESYWEDTDENGDKIETQCKNSISMKPGKISEATPTVHDLIIDNTLYKANIGGGAKDMSRQAINVLTLDENNQTTNCKTAYQNDIGSDDRYWVEDIEVSESEGLTAMAVGDFDGDDYNEVAVYSPEDGDCKILFFQPEQQSDGNYTLKQESYELNLSKMGDRFKHYDGNKRPIVNLNANSQSGRDDLVVSVSEPYTNDDDFCNSSGVFIYNMQDQKTDNGQVFSSDLTYNNNEYRYKFNASCNADLDGDGTDELIIAGNKNTNYKNNDSKGDISTDENLVNIILWDSEKNQYYFVWDEPKQMHANGNIYSENEMNSPVSIAAGKYAIGDSKDTIFCEGCIYNFITYGEAKNKSEAIGKGSLNCDSTKDITFFTNESESFKRSLNDNSEQGTMQLRTTMEPYVGKAETGSFINEKCSEQTLFITGSQSDLKSETSMSLSWVCSDENDGNKVTTIATDKNYIDNKNDDDDGTLLTFCALNVDDDTMYTKYTGKDVGWSNPKIECVIVSPPYWKEIDPSGIGTTKYTMTTSSGDSYVADGNIGLGAGISVAYSQTCFNLFTFSDSLSLDSMTSYIHKYSNGHTHSESLGISNGSGQNMVALMVTPLVYYNYDMIVPEHTTTQKDVDNYVAMNGSEDEDCPEVGQKVEQQVQKMTVSVQLDPQATSTTVDNYNEMVNAFNKSADEDDKLDVVDMSKIYPGMQVGDPTTYAQDITEITGNEDNDDDDVYVSKNSADINTTQNQTTDISMSDTYNESKSNGYSEKLNIGLSEGLKIKLGMDILASSDIGVTLSQKISGGWGQSWTTTNSQSMNYGTTFKPLPSSTPSSYFFNAKLAKWTTKIGNGESISVKDADSDEVKKIEGTTPVIGCLVGKITGAPDALPQDLHVIQTTTDTALLSWTNPTGERKPGSYKVYYSYSADGDYQVLQDKNGKDIVVDGNATSCLATRLEENTDYYFRLEAYSEADAQGIASVKGPYAKGRTKVNEADKDDGIPTIDPQPQDVYCKVDEIPADFNIEASPGKKDDNLTYQWQKLELTNYGASWTNIENQTDPIFNATNGEKIKEEDVDALDGTIYRCVVTEHNGNSYAQETSRSATLYIGDGNRTALNMIIPTNQPSVVEGTEDNEEVNVLPNETINATGNLSEIDNNKTMLGEISNVPVKVHVINEKANQQVALNTGTTDASGNYSINQENGLDAGDYVFVATYEGNGDTRKAYSNVEKVHVLDTNTTYHITYELNGGINDSNNPTAFTQATGVINLNGATKDGATFTGWYSDAALTQKVEQIDCTQQTADMTLYAGWKNIDYTITYELNGGKNNDTNPSTYTIDDTIKLGAPTREGYTFMGWYTDKACTQQITQIAQGSTGNKTLYAKWEKTKYTIDYELNGGTNNASNPATYTVDDTVQLSDPTRDGYTFEGWYADAELTKPISEIAKGSSGDQTVYAKWKAISYQIHYELDGGKNNADNPDAYTIEDTVNLANPTRTGYVFEGWYADSEHTQKVTAIALGSTGDKTLYATWKEAIPEPVKPDQDGWYPISNYDELNAVANAIHEEPETYANAHYYLTTNIVCNDHVWTYPMGTDANPFTGVFDGRDYYIVGLRMSGADVGGLFGVIGNAGTVENLCMVDMDITNMNAGSTVGGLAAVNHGTITGCGSGVNVSNCATYSKNGVAVPLSELNSDVSGATAGGLTGINTGTIIDGHSNANVIGDTAGGLAGHNTGSLQNTFNTGKITGTGEAGGIAGHNEGTMAYGYNSGEVSGSAAVGAIAGSSSQTLGKYYYVNTMAADESQPNLVAMDAEAMRTQTFCDMLNADIGGQDFRSWTYSTSQNKGYPRIKRTVNTMTTLTDPLTGIRVSGCFHPDSQLVIKKVEPGDEAYQALSSANTSGSQIQKAYKINVLSNDGTEAPYEGKIQITFPADLLTNLNNMQIAHLKDGRFDSSKADISLGKATVQVDELGTFGLAQTTDEEGGESVNTGNNNEKTTANTQTNTQDNVNTGLLGKMSPIIFIVLGLAVCGCGYEITVRRKQRNGHEKK